MSGIDWEEVERGQRGRKRPANYVKRQCPYCHKVISESAYSGTDGNWKKHCKACERKKQ